MSRFRKIERALLGIALLLVLIIAGGTAAVFIRQAPPAQTILAQRSHNTPDDSEAERAPFTGIGILRAPLKTETSAPPPTMVIEPVFSYPPNDRAFTEELALHIRDFRGTTLRYFAEMSAHDTRLFHEEIIKQELLQKYNAFLRLGKIEELYFTNFMIID